MVEYDKDSLLRDVVNSPQVSECGLRKVLFVFNEAGISPELHLTISRVHTPYIPPFLRKVNRTKELLLK